MNKTTKLVPIVLLALGAAGLPAQEPARAIPASTSTAKADSSAQQTLVQQSSAPQTPSPYASRRLAMLLEGITLTPAQRTRVDSIVAQYTPMLPVTPPDSTRDSLIQERWRTMLPRMDGEIRLVLTANQQPVWDRNVTAMRNRMRGVGD